MTFVSQLPDVLIVCCLEFLGALELANLDSSFCNKDSRPQLLNLFASNGFVFSDDAIETVDEESCLWLLSRGISFEELELFGTQFCRIAPYMIDIGLGDNVLKTLNIMSGGEVIRRSLADDNARNQLVASFINVHHYFTSIEINAEGFDPHGILKLVDLTVLGSLTSLRLPERSGYEGLIKLLSKHCTHLRQLELDCYSIINNTKDLRGLLVKNLYLTHVSVSCCTFSSFLVESFSTLTSLKYLRLHVDFIDGICEELVRELETKHPNLDFFELLCFDFGLSGKTFGFCVDKQVQNAHKMFLVDGKNPSKNWFGLCFGGSVKELTLDNLMAVSASRFLSAIHLDLPLLCTLTLRNLNVPILKLSQMIAQCAALTTLAVRHCPDFDVEDFVKLCRANPNVVCFCIVQKHLTRAGLELFLRSCMSLLHLKYVVCMSNELRSCFEGDKKRLNEHFVPLMTTRAANPVVLSFDDESDDESDDDGEENEE